MGVLDNLAGLFTGSTGANAAKASSAAQVKGLKQGYNEATGLYNTGVTQAVGAENQALAPWQTIFNQAQPAAQTYWGALGVGTPEQVSAARGAFTASPGYDYTLNQGLEAVDRRAGARGNLTGAGKDEMAYAENLANQDWNSWLTNLSRGLGQQTSAAQGQAGVQGNIADIYSGQGKDLASLAYGTRTGIGQAKAGGIAGAAAAQNSAGNRGGRPAAPRSPTP
jgi:hypothetical protein